MLELRNPKLAVPIVLFAGILWSFGPLVVRYMDSPNLVPWQYIFGRGLTIFILLNLYLYFEEGKKILDNSGLELISASDLSDAAKKIVEAIK